MFDPKVPHQLKNLQQWFSSIITQPIDDESCINPYTPSGNLIKEEAKKYIIPSPTLKPHERIELYNQQYWWRLLSTMHDLCPLLVRLFGYRDFNRILGESYLTRYPPNSWSLSSLINRLPQWVDQTYFEQDRELVLHAAKLDEAYTRLFLAAKKESISLQDNLLDMKLSLQPHIELFFHPFNLLHFRKEVLKQEVEFWTHHDFPSLKRGSYHFILYRNMYNYIVFDPLTVTQYNILSAFKKGATLTEACQNVDESSVSHIKDWFFQWTQNEWLISC